MKRLLFCLCIVSLGFTLTGCNWFGNRTNQNEDMTQTPNTPSTDNGGTTNNGNQQNPTGSMYNSVGDYMMALENGGLVYTNEKDLTDFNFPAYEGKSFMMDNQQFYLYRVNSSADEIKKLLDEVDQNGYVTMRQDDQQVKKYVHRVGDFILVYPEGYDIQKIDAIFNKRA